MAVSVTVTVTLRWASVGCGTLLGHTSGPLGGGTVADAAGAEDFDGEGLPDAEVVGEGTLDAEADGEGAPEAEAEADAEGAAEGVPEIAADGTADGAPERAADGAADGPPVAGIEEAAATGLPEGAEATMVGRGVCGPLGPWAHPPLRRRLPQKASVKTWFVRRMSLLLVTLCLWTTRLGADPPL